MEFGIFVRLLLIFILVFTLLEAYRLRQLYFCGRYSWVKAEVLDAICVILLIISLFKTSSILDYLLFIALICSYVFKCKYGNVSFNLEFHYEGIVLLVSSIYLTGMTHQALLLSNCIFLSSVSAGISKLKSKVWLNGLGLTIFLKLPWRTRKIVRVIIDVAEHINIFKACLIKIGILLPYLQIYTALFLLISNFIYLSSATNPSDMISVIYYVSLIFHLSFALLLYLIGNFGFIPLYYLILVIFASLNISISQSDILIKSEIFIYFSYIFLILYCLKCIGGIHIKNIPIIHNFLPAGAFKMFTEYNMLDMLIPTLAGCDRPTILKKFWAFNVMGRRNIQNFQSDKMYCLCYPIMDFYMINTNGGINSLRVGVQPKYLGLGHEKTITGLFNACGETKILLYQYAYIHSRFKSRLVGYIQKVNGLIHIIVINRARPGFRLTHKNLL